MATVWPPCGHRWPPICVRFFVYARVLLPSWQLALWFACLLGRVHFARLRTCPPACFLFARVSAVRLLLVCFGKHFLGLFAHVNIAKRVTATVMGRLYFLHGSEHPCAISNFANLHPPRPPRVNVGPKSERPIFAKVCLVDAPTLNPGGKGDRRLRN